MDCATPSGREDGAVGGGGGAGGVTPKGGLQRSLEHQQQEEEDAAAAAGGSGGGGHPGALARDTAGGGGGGGGGSGVRRRSEPAGGGRSPAGARPHSAGSRRRTPSHGSLADLEGGAGEHSEEEEHTPTLSSSAPTLTSLLDVDTSLDPADSGPGGAAGTGSGDGGDGGGGGGGGRESTSGGGPGGVGKGAGLGQHGRSYSAAILDADANPTPQSIPPPVFGDQGNIGEKHVLVMVGLPARGKTHMAKRLCQYLRFFHGARTQVFNVGSYRRKVMGTERTTGPSASFFDAKNKENNEQRLRFARAALKDMIDFLFQEDSVAINLEHRGADSGRVAIFDATNTTIERREWIREQLDRLPLKLLFVESVCTDEAIIDRNIWQAKVHNEDYSNDADKQRAFEDFRERIRQYEAVYEPMQEEHLSFIKLINCGRRVEINNIHGMGLHSSTFQLNLIRI